ncbi:lysozyme inhibitor LprI family protein [Burkholderia ambifaria]|uniref:lysozyme inhibitor LprI family protein n=2 Tax=Burkholderia ambifaria TaxID=152480 RepID=UPI001FC879ED|nr:lysozyme inhibitor LprI family protein [Burkholderia ambifaria]
MVSLMRQSQLRIEGDAIQDRANMRKIVLLVAAITFPIISIAAPDTSVQSERELRGECSNGVIGVRECLQEKQEASEVELKRAEEKVRAAFAKWDEDAKYINLAKVRLAASQKAFVKYRTAQCAFASSLGGGAIGNALEMRRLACVAELNNRRAAQLRDAVSDLPLK